MSLPTPPLEFPRMNLPLPLRGLTPFPSFANTPPMSTFQTQFAASANVTADPTSAEALRQNIALAREHIANLQALARSALDGIENAYQPGHSPNLTAAAITSLMENLRVTLDFLQQSGVGALPMIEPGEADVAPPIAEADLIANTANALKLEYEEQLRVQESSGVVANILATDRK